MADNVQFQATQLATPASGTTVSTDEAASGHIQRVKLAYSADGVDTHVTADASGLAVNVGAHLDDIVNSVATTDQAITTKSAVFGYTTSGGGSFEPVKVTPSGALTVEVSDGGGSITVDGTVAATQSGAWNVGITGGVSLPTGAATEYSLGLLGSNLATVTNGSNLRVGGFVDARQTGAWNVGITGTVPVTGTFYQATQPVSIASAVPVTDNGGSLTVDGSVGVTGTVTVDGSGFTQPVSGTVTVQDGGGSLTVDNGGTFAVQAAQSGTWTVQPGNTANTTAWKVDASSVAVPVTDNSGSLTVDAPVATPVFVRLSDGASAIATLPVSLASVPSHAVTNAGTFAVQATQAGTWNINNIAGTISLPTGAATETSLATVAGAVSSSNIRVIVTNPTPVTSSGAQVANVNSAATNVTLMTANANRKGWAVFNDSTQICYLKFGATASTTSFTVRVDPYGYYESGPTVYGGQVDAIWAAANGAARVTEW